MIVTQRELIAPQSVAVPIPQGSPGSATNVSFYDSEFSVATAAAGWNNYRVEGQGLDETWTVSNLTPTTCSTDAFPSVTRLADGMGQISIDNGQAKAVLTLDFRSAGGAAFETLTGFASGSVAAVLASEVASRLTEAAALNYYGANCWAADYDLTAVSFEGNRGGGFSPNYPLTLITEQHAVGSKHIGAYPTGSTYRWKDSTGSAHERTIVGQCPADLGDLVVFALSASLPAGVTPMPIAGSWVVQTAPASGGLNYYLGGAAATMLPSKDVGVVLLARTWRSLGFSTTAERVIDGTAFSGVQSIAACSPASEAIASGLFTEDQERFLLPVVAGNSGSPVFVLTPTTPALIWLWFTSTSGTPVFGGESWLNAAIQAANTAAGISNSYTVTAAPDPS